MIDQHPASSGVAELASRRRLLRLIGAGGAALVATLLPRNGVHAGHDGTNVLHIGEANVANDATQLEGGFVPGTGTTPVLAVQSHQPPIGIIASADNGTAIVARSEDGVGGGPGIGVRGFAKHDGIGILGESLSADGLPDDQDGAGTGVIGASGIGPGVEGISNSGPGVVGHGNGSEPGVVGISQNGPGVDANAFNDNPGVRGHSQGGPGGAFDSDSGPGVVATSQDVGAVVGFSDNGPGGSFSSNNSQGVRGFIQGSGGPGVLGAAPGESPGVRALSAPFGDGGFPPDAGLALEVIGRTRFSTAGSGTVPAGGSAAAIANSAVTAKSHITVTLASDPGPRQLAWVERQPGTGFTVHLTSEPPPRRPATDFTYLIVDMP